MGISFPLRYNVKKYDTAEQATDDNMAHAHFILDNQDRRHALRTYNTYCSSAANNGYLQLASMFGYSYFACIVSTFLTDGMGVAEGCFLTDREPSSK